MSTAVSIRQDAAPAPPSITNPSAAQPMRGSSATYRMLSQWMKPERNVIALPAEYGVEGNRTRIVAARAKPPHAKYRAGRATAPRLSARAPARPASPSIPSVACSAGQFR